MGERMWVGGCMRLIRTCAPTVRGRSGRGAREGRAYLVSGDGRFVCVRVRDEGQVGE